MKLSKRLSIFTFLLLLSLLFLAPVKANAATAGDKLPSPEAGWQRFDERNSYFEFTGSNWIQKEAPSFYYKDTISYTSSDDGIIKFKFKGTKLRIISNKNTSTYRGTNQISIDGKIETYSEISTGEQYQIITYEKTNLTDEIHTVTIKAPDSGKLLALDAVDIDSTGYLVEYYPLINLVAAQGNAKVTLSWGAIEDAASYNVKRSTVQGGPYELVTTTSSTTYTDTNLINGTTYYYIVSANISGKEKSTSNEASATPTAVINPDYLGNFATLVITMTNGGIKEYSLPIADIDKFIT